MNANLNLKFRVVTCLIAAAIIVAGVEKCTGNKSSSE